MQLSDEIDMSTTNGVSRRRVLKMSLAAGGLALSSAASAASPQNLKRTPGEILGPFHPVLKPLDLDADLTIISGKSDRALGQVLQLMGRVLNNKGEPVARARAQIWQANTHGRCAHPSDTNPAPLDPNFQGAAFHITDAKGRYRFKTIKPGAYPTSPSNDWVRPPHIHFEVLGATNRLVTQMYFPGDPLNEKDLLLQGLRSNKEGAIATILAPTKEFEKDSLVAVWDILLDKG